MKKYFVLIVFFSLCTFGYAQKDKQSKSEIKVETIEVKKSVDTKKTIVSPKLKAEVLKINRKKNLDIISIDAYRKSLQIKMKTIKPC